MPVYLTFGVHNHQPVGNFGWVLEEHYQQAYLPFLDVMEPASSFLFSLHTSGPLLLWLLERHPEYVARVRRLAESGRVEVKGGSLYEAILPLIPREDRSDQLARFSRLLESAFGIRPAGSWLPERVWEPSLARDLAEAGLDYTVVDDSHFASAGKEGRLTWGYYLTEDQGFRFHLFPVSKDLRYLIPFQEPAKIISFLRSALEEDERARRCGDIPPEAPPPLLVYDDDGEKFGAWPDTHEQVYKRRWLEKFIEALGAAGGEGWLSVTTPGDFRRRFGPLGHVYLPPASYAEMLEWSGGFFRSFLTRYEEANRLHKRMLEVSARTRATPDRPGVAPPSPAGPQAAGAGLPAAAPTLAARDALLRAQCNDAYWHGIFGGLYLPHLRQTAYSNLIEAEDLLPPGPASSAFDLDFDGHREVRLRSRSLLAYLSPARGGSLMSLDHLPSRAALLDTLRRHPEAEHARLRHTEAPALARTGGTASIHDRPPETGRDLERHLHTDLAPRDSLLDHFYPPGFTWEDLLAGSVEDLGGFALRSYEATMAGVRPLVSLRCSCPVLGLPVHLLKTVELLDGPSRAAITYQVSMGERPGAAGANAPDRGLPPDRRSCPDRARPALDLGPGAQVCFVPEFNINLLGAWSEDYGVLVDGRRPTSPRLADGGTYGHAHSFSLYDGNRGLVVNLDWSASPPATVHRYGVITVSRSEKGYERIYQGTCVAPAWPLAITAGASLDIRIDMTIAQEEVARG